MRWKSEAGIALVVLACVFVWLGAKWIDGSRSNREKSGEYLVTKENGKTVLHKFDVEASRHRVRQGPLASGELMTGREAESAGIDSVCVICALEE